MNFEMENMAIVSTGHLPQGELLELEEAVHDRYGDTIGCEDDYGVIINTGSTLPEAAPHAAHILGNAREAGADWVKFDRDGPTYDNFPTFNW